MTHLGYAGDPPVMVIGNRGDPNTPHAWAVQLTRRLGGAVLVTWKGWGHTWLLNGSSDRCMVRLVDTYLISRVPPAIGSSCS